MKIEVKNSEPSQLTPPADVLRPANGPVGRALGKVRSILRERGLVGLFGALLRPMSHKLRVFLFGTGPVGTGAAEPAATSARPGSLQPPTGKVQSFMRRHIQPRIRQHPRLTIAAVVLILLSITALLVNTARQPAPDQTKQSGKAGTAKRPAVLEKGTPEYRTVLPAGKSILQLGGWTRVSPPDTDAVYAYVDTLAGVPISVSQQPLPRDFKRNPDKSVNELAKAYTATDTLKAGDTTVYIGTSTRGPQSVIFSREDLLILIKSDAPIAADNWTGYINSLR